MGVDFKYGMQTLEMGAARPSTTSDADHEQWEIDVPDEVETEHQSETGKSPQRKSLKSGGKRRGRSRSRRSDKLRRPKYQQVDSEKVDVDHDENDGAENADAVSRLNTVNTVETAVDDRNAYDFRRNDCLKIVDIPSSKPSVSPPSTVSMLKANKKIPVQDVQPAFYVPGYSHMLASPPLPPQPNSYRIGSVPKPEHSGLERDGDGD